MAYCQNSDRNGNITIIRQTLFLIHQLLNSVWRPTLHCSLCAGSLDLERHLAGPVLWIGAIVS